MNIIAAEMTIIAETIIITGGQLNASRIDSEVINQLFYHFAV